MGASAVLRCAFAGRRHTEHGRQFDQAQLNSVGKCRRGKEACSRRGADPGCPAIDQARGVGLDRQMNSRGNTSNSSLEPERRWWCWSPRMSGRENRVLALPPGGGAVSSPDDRGLERLNSRIIFAARTLADEEPAGGNLKELRCAEPHRADADTRRLIAAGIANCVHGSWEIETSASDSARPGQVLDDLARDGGIWDGSGLLVRRSREHQSAEGHRPVAPRSIMKPDEGRANFIGREKQSCFRCRVNPPSSKTLQRWAPAISRLSA